MLAYIYDMNKILPVCFFLFLLVTVFTGTAQLTVNDNITVTQLVQNLIGKGAVVSNVKMNCPDSGYGSFNGTNANLGLKDGILLTTGKAKVAVGPNNITNAEKRNGKEFADPDLTKIVADAIYDPCILEFDIIPSCDKLNMKYVFGSEEYPDFVCSNKNDVFGFFITGPNPKGGNYTGQNIALIPGTSIAVAINSVNSGTVGGAGNAANCTSLAYSSFYFNNNNGTSVQYNAFTKPLTANVDVVACQKYHIKIAIADAGDEGYDSGVFLSNQGLECDSVPVVKITANATTICPGESVTLNASGATSYAWSPPAGLSSTSGSTVIASPTATTKYYVTAAGLAGCASTTAKDSITITVKSCGFALTATGGTICEGNCADLTALAVGSSTYTYSWSHGLTGAGPVKACPTETTTYTVTATDNNGGTATATALVTVNPKPLITVPSSSICIGKTAGLTAGGNATTFTWSNGSLSNSIEVQPTTTTSYTVTGTNANGCSNTATATVRVNELPAANAGSDITICPGLSTTLTASGGITYLWSPSSGLNTSTGATVIASPSVVTQYIVTVTDSNTCSKNDTVTVAVAAAVVGTVSPDAVICRGSGTVLTAAGGSNYTWSPATGLNTSSGASVTANPDSTTTYSVVIGNGNCAPVTKQVTVTVSPLPKAIFGDTSGCFPFTVTLKNNSTGGTKYFWDFGDGTTSNLQSPAHVYSKPGKYTVKLVVTSAQGCKDSLSKKAVELYPGPQPDFSFDPGKIDVWNPTVKFTNTSNGNGSWLWKFGDDSISTLLNPKHTYKDSGTYQVCLSIQDTMGCSNTLCKEIRVLPDWTLYIPNAFTPNDDGINDSFRAYSSFVKEYEIWIFDRWGNRVFNSKDMNQHWNGKINNGQNGELMGPIDVYVYRIQIKDIFNKVHKYLGHVTLIR